MDICMCWLWRDDSQVRSPMPCLMFMSPQIKETLSWLAFGTGAEWNVKCQIFMREKWLGSFQVHPSESILLSIEWKICFAAEKERQWATSIYYYYTSHSTTHSWSFCSDTLQFSPNPTSFYYIEIHAKSFDEIKRRGTVVWIRCLGKRERGVRSNTLD